MSTTDFHGPNPGAVAERARTLLRMGRAEAAERELRGALAADPLHVVSHSLLALTLVTRGAVDEAIAEAGEAVRLAPEHWFPHYMAGQVLYYADRPEEALRAARAALAIDLDQAQIWELLARVHGGREEWPLMAEAARRGLALDPHDSKLVSFLAVALGELGDREQALAVAGDAVRLDPEAPLAHLVYGRVLLAFGSARDAARAFREVLRLDPGMDRARELLVVALKRRNPLYRAVSRLPGSLGSWRVLALLPLISPLIAIFVVIAVAHWAMWVAESLVTLRLARGAYNRLLFRRGELRSAVLCCAVLAGGTALLVLGVTLSHPVTGVAGAALLALVTPIQEAAYTASPLARKILTGWAGALALVIAVSLALSVLWPARIPTGVPLLAMWAGLGTIWVAAAVRRLFGRVTPDL
ncbi:Tetratricopeptide (TPR) repeat [Streptosporangium canum]|uniref:Tetratricopeptide (TPR) repeat n=1 Tax=Streptosporangium canum TaxID=324952 RepID=A0A1I3LT85_9ACTN|nr:tetratricopeptide repeat protein [Streptosporangium canum]SFI87994.1 Tetratricopeptide (TPR) repeat [Streptosporangium canum]